MPYMSPTGLEQQALVEIEFYFDAFDRINPNDDRPLPIEPDSQFARDHNALNHPNIRYPRIDHMATSLLVAASDHLHSIRQLAGSGPGGFAKWHTHAPWTELRAALEIGSQVVWLIGPADRDERLARLLRLWREDTIESFRATALTYSRRRRSKLTDMRDWERDEFDVIAAPWDAKSERIKNQMRTQLNLAECIRYAARKSEVMKQDDWAELFWRVASGHAHGRPWAHLAVGDIRPIGRTSESTTLVRGLIDLEQASKMIGLTVGIIQYADWLIAKLSGHPFELGPVARMEFRDSH